MDLTHIYGLCDPRNGELRYIGKSNNPENRLKSHISKTKIAAHPRRSAAWIASLLKHSILPEMFVIESIPKSEWRDAEQFNIAYFKSIGARLTNLTIGGEGSATGKRNSDWVNPSKGINRPEELKQRLSAANLKDLSGLVFGRLTVVRFANRATSTRQSYWVCKCECGVEKKILGASLKTGKTQSCGCRRNETSVKNAVIARLCLKESRKQKR